MGSATMVMPSLSIVAPFRPHMGSEVGGGTLFGLIPESQWPALPAQHGIVSEHAWPSSEHIVSPPQVPCVEPGGNTQVPPAQQSASDVHELPVWLQPEPQRSTPFWSGTHGAPLQQSPLNAHVSPVMRQAEPRP